MWERELQVKCMRLMQNVWELRSLDSHVTGEAAWIWLALPTFQQMSQNIHAPDVIFLLLPLHPACLYPTPTIVAWLWESDLMASLPCETRVHNWTSVSEPHTSAFNVAVRYDQWSVHHGHHHLPLPSCVPILSQNKYCVCPTMRPHLSNADRGRG